MIRAIMYALLGVLLISFLRGVIGILTKGVADLFKEESAQQRPQGGPSSSQVRDFGGELVKDPVCGTYVSTNSKFRKTVGGATHVFCSEKCRDSFAA